MLDTPQEIENALADFKTLEQVAGWQRVVKIVEANIEILKDQILDGFEEETKESIDRKRDKLKAYKEVIETPKYWINRLETKETEEEVDDPYHTVDSLRKDRDKQDN